MREPRPYTHEECREMVLQQLKSMMLYCLGETRRATTRGKLDLLVFSILAMIDGSDIELPAFRLVPHPHEQDANYHRDNGENWWPDDFDLSDGELHSRWARMKNGEEPTS